MRPRPFGRDRRVTLLAFVGLVMPWSCRAGFDFWDNAYTASQAELQAMIAARFPRSQRYGDLVGVTLSDPRITLDAVANRAAVTADLAIASPLIGAGRALGSVSLGSALRYDAATRSLRLAQARIERLTLQGIADDDLRQLQSLAGPLVQQLLEGQVLRSFTAEELTVGSKTYEIVDIAVVPGGVRVRLR